jgi:hypothetical protein
MKVVIVSELGGNNGHLINCQNIETTLKKNFEGVDSTIIIDKKGFLRPPDHSVFKRKPETKPTQISDILVSRGISEGEPLKYVISGWKKMFTALSPDIVFFNYAPLALLAAKEFNFKKVTYESPFSLPATDDHNDELLVAINAVSKVPINSLFSIYQNCINIIYTIEELDFKKPKREEVHYTPLLNVTEPSDDGFGLFYIYNEKTLDSFDFSSPNQFPFIVYSPIKREYTRSFDSSFYEDMTRCRFYVSHGGVGGITRATVLGKPSFCFPLYYEQAQNARALKDNRIGRDNFTESYEEFQELANTVKLFSNKYKETNWEENFLATIGE